MKQLIDGGAALPGAGGEEVQQFRFQTHWRNQAQIRAIELAALGIAEIKRTSAVFDPVRFLVL